MKRIVTLFSVAILILAFESLFAQINDSTPPDSVILNYPGQTIKYFYTYNSNGSLTEDKSIFFTDNEISQSWRTIFEYDESNNRTLKLVQKQDSSGWVNFEKDEYEYDNNNNLILEFAQFWRDSAWVDDDRHTVEYNSEGKPVTETFEYWHMDQWNFDYRFNREYDENGYLSSLTEIVGSYENLINYERVTFVNDSEGNVLEQIEHYHPDSSWIPLSQYLNSYNQDGLLDTTTFSFWEETFWDLFDRITYSYDNNGNKTEALEQNFWDSVWVNWSLDSWVYNQLGKIEEYYTSSSINGDWEKNASHFYEYDTEGNNTFQEVGIWQNGVYRSEGIIGELFLRISDNLEFTYFGTSFEAFYTTGVTAVNGIDQLPTKFRLEQNYPNPFNPATKIKFTIPAFASTGVTQQTTLTVYNSIGQKVATLLDELKVSGTYEVNFNAGSLASGVYYYTLSTNGFSVTKKMMLVK